MTDLNTTLHPPPAKMTLIFPEEDLAYVGVPKCASTSIRRAMYSGGMNYLSYYQDEALRAGTRITVIRNPLDRVFSAWNYGWKGTPFPQWWDFIKEDPNKDIHTYRMTDWIAPGKPTEVYRLEAWDQWWPMLVARYPKLFTETMPWRNYIERDFAIDDYVEFHEEIAEVYSDDFALYNRTENKEAAAA